MLITAYRLLKEIEKAGHIELCDGTKQFGYIADGKMEFQFGKWNEVYVTRYLDGCFYPFLFKPDGYGAFTREENGGLRFAFIVSNPDSFKDYVILRINTD